jgi:EXLDI family protein
MRESSVVGEASMPNRTIYVADADLPIFEKAQQLAGENLSATIAQALRRFVETEEARASGYEEVTVSVGRGRPCIQKQFRGRSLIKRRLVMENKARLLTLEVYQTVHGRFALYSKNSPSWDWSSRSKKTQQTHQQAYDGGWNWDWSISGWGAAFEPDEQRLDVFENLETLKEAIPEEMYESLARYLRHGDDIEFMDI